MSLTFLCGAGHGEPDYNNGDSRRQRQSSPTLSSNTTKMNGLLVGAFLVATTLVTITNAVLVTGTAITIGTGGTALAAGAAIVGALAIGAKVKLLASRKRHGKRAALDCVSLENPEMYFTLAANGDFLDCGRRFVCELEATPEENLTSEEQLIRNLFGRGFITTDGSAGNYYAEAGKMGAAGGVGACVDAFSKCPYDRKTLFLAFQEVQGAQ